MPSDDYASVGSGSLRLKGARVEKKKKKKNPAKANSDLEKKLDVKAGVAGESPERRLADHQDEEAPEVQKTDAERRYDEFCKKRLLQLSQAGGGRPNLLKTHKERVEELNTYLSKLSEHHDMPKIGPG